VWSAAAAAVPSPSVDAEAEDELKSVIVKNFLRYSTWPGVSSPVAPFTVGVFGRPSFAQALHSVLDGKPVNGRAVQVIELKSASDFHRCQLIYFATDRDTEIRQGIQSIKSAHTLTIGEHERFLAYGGAVGLLQIDGHMGFEVSLEALDRAGIEISSKLLRLGQIKRRHEQ
jgi:hypothetical protein